MQQGALYLLWLLVIKRAAMTVMIISGLWYIVLQNMTSYTCVSYNDTITIVCMYMV